MRHSISKPGKQIDSFLDGLHIHKQMTQNYGLATSYSTSSAVRGGHGSMRPLNMASG